MTAKKQLAVALQVVEDIKRYDLKPDNVTFATLIKGAVELNEMPTISTIINMMKAEGIDPQYVAEVFFFFLCY